MEPSEINQARYVGTTPQYFHTYILSHFAPVPCIVTCVHRRVVLGMKSCRMCSAGCVIHVVVYGEWVVCIVVIIVVRTKYDVIFSNVFYMT